MSLYQIFHPAVFQGNLNKKRYFEGWYFKHVSADFSQVLAIIPGISLSSDPHAFIQLIDGKSGQTHYLTFPAGDFRAERRKFEVRIGDNFFSANRISLNLDQQGVSLSGQLEYPDPSPWPVSLIRPGIMGWYRYVPRMECYHGVVSVNHSVKGFLTGKDMRYDFENGHGYIEKDWGTSFPEQWIWIHANCFSTAGSALMVSIAKIPWRGRHFVGFLGFLHHEGKTYRYFTYNRSRLVQARREGQEVSFKLENRQHSLEVTARQLIAGELKAPVHGLMERYIKESIDSEVSFVLRDRKGKQMAAETSSQAGLEIVGDVLALI